MYHLKFSDLFILIIFNLLFLFFHTIHRTIIMHIKSTYCGFIAINTL